MKRLHLFEFEDFAWFPHNIRNYMTEYLRVFFQLLSIYAPLVPLLQKLLAKAHTSLIVDLCSGSGGPWLDIYKRLQARGTDVRVTLTDKFPNIIAFKHIQNLTQDKISYEADSVDATDCPDSLRGLRTLFESFHHLKPEQARGVLQDAFQKRQAIGVFEVTYRNAFNVFITLFNFIPVLLLTPFIRPFSWERLFWTYILPLIPLLVTWDGVISQLRTYTTEELREMVKPLQNENYLWEIGQVKTYWFWGQKITYLMGYPS